MEAIFCGDEQEAALIEESAFNLGYGPLTDCSTVANCSQQKAYCREFIRHPIVQSFLISKFPLLISPTLADWHVSLSNRSHIRAYIKQALEAVCPFGTDWAG
ncbi:hypothetical protein K438DRAFT_1613266 [Mycena galopus ATCC 62051]|nr:hypothetical protein K438DRAFT_1613266 [Mycena galopus ATCC 62051]